MTKNNKYEKLRKIHQKKLGVLLIDAREKTKKTVGDCAKVLHMDPSAYVAIEHGNETITLPQLEVLSYFFRLPVTYFFTDKLLSSQIPYEDEKEYTQAMIIRDKTIATKIIIRRQELGFSVEEMARKLGTDVETIEKVESGNYNIPLVLLEQIAFVLDYRMKELFARKGNVGKWNQQQDMHKTYERIPEEIQVFISNPSNEPYLRLAMHLSSMSAEKLRAIAEGLLEITF